jgi:radical SAM superfamily enzyme YgiQ (UPF0313 family)
MNVLLVSANTERINMVAMPLGLGLVAAATRRAGHDVTLVDLLNRGAIGTAITDAIAMTQPEVIGISVRNIDDQSRTNPRFLLEQVRGVVLACRANSEATIVLGGAGYSIFPAEALAYLGGDFGIWGDGEVAFPALLEQLVRGREPCEVNGVLRAATRSCSSRAARASPEELDAMPLWDDALIASADPHDPDLWIPVQSRRGCPNDCAYCSTARIQGRRIRCRSPHLVVEQIGRLAQAGYRRFYFVDNSFNIPEAHAHALCDGLRELRPRIEWRCILYPHQIEPALVCAMAKAGCVEVALGFESGSVRVLRSLGKRFTPDEVRQSSALLRDHGIRRMGFLLFGGPGETRESVEESLAFARELGLDGLRVTAGIRIYPDTPLGRLAVAQGVIRSEADLLQPRFYVSPEVDGWIDERIAEAAKA